MALVATVLAGAALRLWAVQRTVSDASGRPLIDDSYYYFALGRNLAGGAGFRIDAEHVTTGFQPLWGLLCALPFWLVPGAAITGVQVLGVIVAIGTVIALYALVARLSGSPAAGLFAASLWAVAPPAVVYSVNGMDTGLAVLGAVLLLVCAQAMISERNLGSVGVAGLACGAAILARVDLLFLGAAVALALLVFPPLPRRWRTVSVFVACGAIPLLPWLLIALSLGKSPLPESGAAVRLMSTLLEGGGDSPFPRGLLREVPRFADRAAGNLHLLDAIPPPVVGGDGQPAVMPEASRAALLWPSLWLTLWLALWAMARTRIERTLLGIWSVYAVLTLVGYAGYVGGGWFYGRYGTPLAETFGALAVAILGARVAQARGSARPWLVGAATIYLLLTFVRFTTQLHSAAGYRWLWGRPQPLDGFERTSQWLNTHLEPDDRVGVFQSGLIGFRAAMPVINLDGKVNADARLAMERGRMWEYLCETRIDYVADWQALVGPLLAERSAAWQLTNLQVMEVIDRGDGNDDWKVYRVDRANCREDDR